MSKVALSVENVSKLYRLGEIGTGTISHDLNRWLARIRGKEDPFSQIGVVNDRTKKAASNFVWALKDINFQVNEGEVLGIIGRNGAGKSTLLKLISRITSPSRGEIKIKGRIASLLEVGTGMHPEMTARENIYLNGAIMGMTKKEIKSKFDEILDFAGCTMYADTPVKRFSSGMRVRLGFAVAAFLEPEILIVDEVLAVGDAEFQKKAIGKMQDVSKSEGRTVLFVSHNMGSIATLCKSCLLMNQGQVHKIASPQECIAEYNTLNSDNNLLFNEKDKPIYLKSISFLNEKKENVNAIPHNEIYYLALNIVHDKIPEDGIIAIALLDNLKRKLFTEHHYFRNFPDKSKRQSEILIKFPSGMLTPGEYSFIVNLHDSYTDFDGEQDVCSFNVFDAGSKFYKWENRTDYGRVFVNTEIFYNH